MIKALLLKQKYNCLLILSAFLLYGNTIQNGYGLDDEFVTGPNNITSKGFKSIPKVFRTFHVMDESGNNYEYRPLVKVTFAIEAGLWGQNLALSHFMNIVYYALCLVLLLKLLKLWLKNYKPFLIFIMVLIFAVIPVHSEVVASLKNRDVLLSFAFSISSFYFFIKYFDSKVWLNLMIAFVLLALAFLSKFDVLPFLILIPLTQYKRCKLSLRSVLLIGVLFVFAYISYRSTKVILFDKSQVRGLRIYQYFENPLYFKYEFLDRISACFNSLGFYTKMMIWPSKMACYYGYNVVPVYSFTSFYFILGMIVGFMMLFIITQRFKQPDLLWYGIIVFGICISMYLNLAVPAAGIVADRFLFFASIGFPLVFVYLLFDRGKEYKQLSNFKDIQFYKQIVLVTLLVVFSFVTINRNSDWKNKMKLFETDSEKYPESVKLSLLRSSQIITLLSDGSNSINENDKIFKIREAELALSNAIRVDSSCTGCYNNLAYLYLTYDKDPTAALPYLQAGFKRDSTKKEVACNIGIAYYRLNQYQKAKYFLHKAIKLDKKDEFQIPYEILQHLYSKTNPKEGVEFFVETLKKGAHPELMNLLIGQTFLDVTDTLQSLRYFKEAERINPQNKVVSDFITKLEVKLYKNRY